METAVRAIAKQEEFTEEDVQAVLDVLSKEWIRKVRHLRAMSVSGIKELGLPAVVKEYMLRVKTHHVPQ